MDASIDPRLVEAFPDHHVRTLFDPGWQHLKDHVQFFGKWVAPEDRAHPDIAGDVISYVM